MNRRVVVTGGAGFLGSHVVRLLLEGKNDVVVIDDFSNGKLAHLDSLMGDPRLRIERGDITRQEDVSRAFQGCHKVIHLAVLDLRQSIKDPGRVSQVNVLGTVNCLEAARRNQVELFLNCSSSEVYGSAVYVPMDERHPIRPETPYGASKVAQDMVVYSYGCTYGLPWATFRPFNMYGPNSHWQGFRGELIPRMIVRAMNRLPLVIFGDGHQTRDFVFVEEAARALMAVVENPDSHFKPINFCSGTEVSIRKIAETICRHFQLDPAEFILNKGARPGDVRRHLGDNSQFRGLFGFVPRIGIEEGLRLTIDWLKSLPFKPEELLSEEVERNWE